MNSDLQEILREDNPWLDDDDLLAGWLESRVPPGFLPRCAQAGDLWEETDLAHLVIGPRRAGKTTLLRSWLAERGEPALAIDCEQQAVQRWCRSAPLFLRELRELVPGTPALLFDEIQHIEEAGLFVKGLVDRRYPAPLLVTGSSAWHLGSRTRESLAGRATRTRLLPFSLAEVSQGKVEGRPPLQADRLLREVFEEHVVRGGYPDVWLGDRPARRLVELIDAFVVRDASDLFHIDRPDLFRRLMALVAGQVGSVVNQSEWGALLGLSRHTVASYLAILEEAHVLQTVRPFAGGKRSELTRRPKVYFVDCGLRNQLAGGLTTWEERGDKGPLLENWVFSELIKGLPMDHSLHFWRSTSGAEVDFVLVGPDRIQAVEVKAGALGRAKVPRAARSFVEAYAPERLVVVNMGLEVEGELGATRVVWCRPEGLWAALGL